MSITALVTGKLIADPERRTSTSGKTFTTARLAAAGDGDDNVLCSVIAFGSAAEPLAALAKGDTAAIVGRTKPKTWAGKDGAMKVGLDVVAEQVLTAYHLRRKRAAMAGEAQTSTGPRSTPVGRSGAGVGHEPEFAEDDEWLRRER